MAAKQSDELQLKDSANCKDLVRNVHLEQGLPTRSSRAACRSYINIVFIRVWVAKFCTSCWPWKSGFDLHTRCVETCLVPCASTYIHERIYATHVLVTVLCGSVLCGLRKNTHKRSHSRGFVNLCHYHVCDIYNKSSWPKVCVCEWGRDGVMFMCAQVYNAALCSSTVRNAALGLWLVGHP